jgi:hypothetical protein
MQKEVANGGEQLQQLNQPPLCDGSAYKGKLLGRHRRRSLRLPPFPSLRTPDTDYLVICSKWHYCQYLRLHNPAFGFGPTMGVFMAVCRCGRNGTHHRLRLPLLL